jgi:hypothetical protein
MHQLQQLRSRIAFDIELDTPFHRLQVSGDMVDVGRRDVPRVRPRMDGDARSAGVHTNPGRIEHRWHSAAARISDGCDFVDVDGELDGAQGSGLRASGVTRCCRAACAISSAHAEISR